MNVIELADKIAAKHGVEKKQAKLMVEGVFKEVVDAAQHGEEISIPGFGKFKVASREARQGRNPATGETINIAASKKLNFTPAKQVKDAMNPPPTAPKAAPAAKGKAKK